MGPPPSKATAKKSKAKPAPTQEHQTADSSDKGRKARTASSKVPGAGKKAGGPPKAAAAIDESPSSSGDEGEDGEVPTAAPKSSGMSRKATKALRPSKQALRESNGASDSDDEDVGASDDSIEEASSDDNLASLREKLARTVGKQLRVGLTSSALLIWIHSTCAQAQAEEAEHGTGEHDQKVPRSRPRQRDLNSAGYGLDRRSREQELSHVQGSPGVS